MKNELPNAEQFVDKLVWFTIPSPGEKSPFDKFRDEMVTIFKQYGELCAKYGAKSIRYKAIEMIQEDMYFDTSSIDDYYLQERVNQLISKIQNLNP